MKLIVSRVLSAACSVDGAVTGSIGKGLLVYVGFAPSDKVEEVEYMIDRVRKMRIFEDEAGKMNRSVEDVGGEVLWVPNFTLYADPSSRRPSFSGAMAFADAKALFDYLLQADARWTSRPAQAGVFGADMRVKSEAWGPVNVIVWR